MESTGSVFYANQFNFFINKNDDYQKSFTGKTYNIILAPTKNYVYPNANKHELKALADFIYQTLEKTDEPNDRTSSQLYLR